MLGTIGGVELSFADLAYGIQTGAGLLACQQAFLGARERVDSALAAAV